MGAPDIPVKWINEGRYRVDPEAGPMKQCARCLHYWPADAEYFFKCKATRDGLQYYCKTCHTSTQQPIAAGFDRVAPSDFERFYVYRLLP